MRDPYANHMVQKVINVTDERQCAAIMRYVKENITQLYRYTYDNLLRSLAAAVWKVR